MHDVTTTYASIPDKNRQTPKIIPRLGKILYWVTGWVKIKMCVGKYLLRTFLVDRLWVPPRRRIKSTSLSSLDSPTPHVQIPGMIWT